MLDEGRLAGAVLPQQHHHWLGIEVAWRLIQNEDALASNTRSERLRVDPHFNIIVNQSGAADEVHLCLIRRAR